MGMIITRERLLADLRALFSSIEGDAVAFHTDLRRVGVVERVKPRDEALDEYLDAIHETSGGRTLLFPTFNYDFCGTGVYDVREDPCQVGALNEHVRRRNPGQRTRTPVFNFCILENRGFSLDACALPLAEGSTFCEMVERGTEIVLLGTEISADTLFHYVEELAGVGYRYPKPFPGVIREQGSDEEITISFRMRPMVGGSLGDEVEYDYVRLRDDALRDGVLSETTAGNGRCYHHRADRMMEYWLARITEDELYLLTPNSRRRVAALYARFGRPLRREVFEPAAAPFGAR